MKRLAIVLAAAFVAIAVALFGCAGGGSAASAPAQAPVRDSVDAYSWEELSAISKEIQAAGDDEAALAIAKRYHLAAEDGTLDGSQSKEVELANGVKTRAVVAGFNHEELPGGGKAGITFIFADAVALRGMNNNAGFDATSEADDFDVVGGWNASELRGWLNGEFVNDLPSDLRASLANVVKSGLVVPARELELDDTGTLLSSVDSLIGQGIDRLWVPALVELTGVKESSRAAKEYPEWTAPLRAEGSQYQLFADTGASERQPNDLLVRSVAGGDGTAQRWWLRSAEDWTFAQILEDGSIDRRDETPTAPTPPGHRPLLRDMKQCAGPSAKRRVGLLYWKRQS